MKLTNNDKYLTISGNSKTYVYTYDPLSQSFSRDQNSIASVVDNHALGNYAGQLAVITQTRLISIYGLCITEG